MTLGSLILIGGSLGDIYGRRRVFAIGIGAFGVLSLACATAPTDETLIAARALQGVAGALADAELARDHAAAFPERERGARRSAPGPPAAGSRSSSARWGAA